MQMLSRLALIAAFAFPLAALAHGGGEHVMGTVQAVADDGLTVETADKKSVRVAFDAHTRFEKDGAPSSAKELHAGDRVVVHAAKQHGPGDAVAVLVKFEAQHASAAPGVAPATAPIAIAVTEDGFTPDRVTVKGGAPVNLVLTRKTEKTCATEVVIPEYGIKRALPLNEAVAITFTPKKNGEIRYSCGMGMIRGVLSVE